MGFLTSSSYQADENLPTGTQTTDYSKALAQALQGIQQPQFDPTQANATAGQQNALDASLQGTISGAIPSASQITLNNALTQNNQNTAGQLAGVRGMNPALAQRLIAQNQAAANQTAAGQGAQLQATNINNAQGTLASALAAQRSADIGQASNATQLGIAGNAQNTNQLGTVGQLANSQNNSIIQNKLGAEGINAGTAQANASSVGNVLGGLIGGAATIGAAALADGGPVEGQEVVSGDSPKNDVVPIMASAGEVVIPKSKATPEKAKQFMQALQSRKTPKGRETKGYGDVLQAHKELQDRMAMLEMACGGMVPGSMMNQGGEVKPAVSPQDEFLKRLGSAYMAMRMARVAQPEAALG